MNDNADTSLTAPVDPWPDSSLPEAVPPPDKRSVQRLPWQLLVIVLAVLAVVVTGVVTVLALSPRGSTTGHGSVSPIDTPGGAAGLGRGSGAPTSTAGSGVPTIRPTSAAPSPSATSDPSPTPSVRPKPV